MLTTLSKATYSNYLSLYLSINILLFKSLIIKPGLDLFSSLVRPTLKKRLCFKV